MFYEVLIKAFLILLSAIFVEGATELVTKSQIFSRLRELLKQRRPFFDKLLGCGYCFSVWASIPPAIVMAVVTTTGIAWGVIAFLGYVVILHRLSNYIHNFNDKHLDKYYSSKEK